MGLSTLPLRASWVAFCGMLQLFFAGSVRAQSAPPPAQPGGSPAPKRVLLVHGIYNSERAMRRMKQYLEARGWEACSISLKPSDASVSFDAMARQLEGFADAAYPNGEKFDLVAFSMGGLVSRYYIQKLGGYRRVRRFITVSTPNHGTAWAWLGSLPGVKEMRPGSAMLRELNGDTSRLVPLDYTSLYTPFDLSIVPASSSRMTVARNVICWVPLHPLMIIMPGPMREVELALER
ncbi:MAG: alpha/beta fold hydrolase [Chthoniobacteraceae bacterium]|jgi:triacylglycerol lipase